VLKISHPKIEQNWKMTRLVSILPNSGSKTYKITLDLGKIQIVESRLGDCDKLLQKSIKALETIETAIQNQFDVHVNVLQSGFQDIRTIKDVGQNMAHSIYSHLRGIQV
jgi:hypothetical protein